MNSLMRIAVLCAVTLGAISCIRSEVDESETSDLSISLSPNFGRSDADDAADASQGAVTRVTSTDFESGDALGLYVVLDGRDLAPSGNAVTNGLMSVLSSGAIVGQPLPISYPSRTSNVHFYSYYPYSAVVSDITAHRFAVRGDQTLLVDYKASDFCYGRSMGVSPSAAAKPISYSHKMSQLLINVSAPLNVGAKKVVSVKSGVIYGVQSDATLNLSTGVMTTAAARVDSVKMYRDATVTTSPSGTTTHFTAIIPAQTLAVGGALMNFLVTFSDGSSAYYIYNSTSVVALGEGTANVFNLVVGDRGAVSLSGAPTVAAWASVTEGGILTQQISNSFSAIWKLPIKDYKKINSVVLGINDPVLGSVRRQVTTGFSINADNSADKVVFKFNFTSDEIGGLTYPYTIDYVEFCEGVDSLRRCSSMIAANVTRRGAYTLGIEAEHVVAITVGDFDEWDDLLYGDMTRGVDNDFRVSLIEYPHFADIATLKLRIDGEVFTFNNAACIEGSNQLVATTKDVRFPDANGRAPYKYPFTIERVELYNSGGALISGGGYPAAVAVNRAGLVTLRMYKGAITSTTATVTGYNTSSGQGRPEFGGAVENNPLRVVYCVGSATAQLSCLDVERVEVVINNQTVVLSGYKALMIGSQLAVQSSAPHVNIASGAGSKPTVYPYYISKISLKKADGTLLFSSALDEPLKVDWYGEITVEIMEKMAAGIPEAIMLDGVKWATGNLVADGKGGCRIGAPGDCGLYFQYGGLIGYKGGFDGDGRGFPDSTKLQGKFWGGAAAFSANDIAITPAGYSKSKDIWPFFENQSAGGYGYYYYSTLASKGANFSDQPNGYDPSLGIGDPCTHYLGGNWRLPDFVELSAITGTSWDNSLIWLYWSDASITGRWASEGPSGVGSNGAWFGPNSRSATPTFQTDLFIPAAGYLNARKGGYMNIGIESEVHSSSNFNSILYLYMSSMEVNGVVARKTTSRANGAPARCVDGVKKVTRPIPPVDTDVLVLNGLRWTKGNLVASGPNNARVGAPGDGGLYFQYGGLIGYKGGSVGDGTGMPDPELENKCWDFATSFSSNDVALTPTGYAKPTDVWPNFDNLATGGYGYYYYSDFTTKYADFQKQANGKDISLGIGDACEVYLGSPWRLPTITESSAITGVQVEGKHAAWNDPNLTGKWVVNGPLSNRTTGGWFGPNSKTGTPNVNTDLFVPASGYLYSGRHISINAHGNLWSSSIFDKTDGFFTHLQEVGVASRYNDNRAKFGFPVRCVADDVVEIGGVKWAKGNLVANGPNSCVIGKPTDGGLYFQFGSLLGWKGGASGDGVGIGSPALAINIKPSTYSATPAYTACPYYAGGTTAADLVPFATDGGASAIGDPCRFYLGGTWRLPTTAEHLAMHNAGSVTYNGGWTAASPGYIKYLNGLQFPASGFRNISDGALALVGERGYGWSESVCNGTHGYTSYFYSGYVNPQDNYNRRHGFPVRCVKD